MNFLRHPVAYITVSDVLIALSLLLLTVTGRLHLRGPFGAASTVWWLAGPSLLVSALLVSSLVNGSALRGIVYAVQYFFAYFRLCFARTELQLTRLTKVYVFSIVLMCLHGIYLIYVDGQTNTTFVSVGSGRFTGFIERENECAAVSCRFPCSCCA